MPDTVNYMKRWIKNPSPFTALDLAIADHKAFCDSTGGHYDYEFLAMLRECQLIVAKNAARNRKTGGKA